MNEVLILKIVSLLLALAGTFLLAFGLRVKESVSPELKKELGIDKRDDLIAPSEVSQRKCLIGWGLALITVATMFQFVILYLS